MIAATTTATVTATALANANAANTNIESEAELAGSLMTQPETLLFKRYIFDKNKHAQT